MKKRLFAFGCSMTKYVYGTWADFLSANFDEYYNYGRSGADMRLICNRFIEADNRFNLNPETDYVVVMLTGIGRFSYMKSDSLETHGDLVVHAANNPNNKDVVWIVDNIWSEKWQVYNAWVAAHTIKKILTLKKIKHKILLGLNYDWYMNNTHDLSDEDISKVSDIIYGIADNPLSITTFFSELDQTEKKEKTQQFWKDKNNYDGHPSQYVHYEYMKKMFPEFNTILSEKVFNYCQEINIQDSLCKQSLKFSDLFVKKYDTAFYFKPFGEKHES